MRKSGDELLIKAQKPGKQQQNAIVNSGENKEL